MQTPTPHPEEYDVVVLGSGEAGKYIAWTPSQKGNARREKSSRGPSRDACRAALYIACLRDARFTHPTIARRDSSRFSRPCPLKHHSNSTNDERAQRQQFVARQFLLASALAGGGLMLPTSAMAQNSMQMPMASATATPPVKTGPTEVSLRIGPVLVDVTKDKTISTIGYNGQVPGPLIRLQEGKQVSVQLFNDTDTPEFVHWHGQFIPSEVDGAGEEKKHCGAASWASQLSIHSQACRNSLGAYPCDARKQPL